MIIDGQVGQPAGSAAPGARGLPFRQGHLLELIMSELHGVRYESTRSGRRFGGAMQAVLATATIAGLGTGVTGATVLYNPPGSAVNVSIEEVGVGFVLPPAAALSFGIATGFSLTALTGTLTSLAPKSKLIGSGFQPVAGLVASASVTLPLAATVDKVLGELHTGAATTVTAIQGRYPIDGSIILPPGGYAHFWTSAVLAASAHLASWEWEEVPI